jgi:hypothetical protein
MRLVSQLDCRSSETSSILVRGAKRVRGHGGRADSKSVGRGSIPRWPATGLCGRPRACLASRLSGGGTRRLHQSCRRSSKAEQSLGTRSGTVRFRATAPGRRCIRCSVRRRTRQRRPIDAGILEARGRSSKPCRASSTLAVRSDAGEAARCGSALPMRSRRVRFSSPAPGCSRLPLCALARTLHRVRPPIRRAVPGATRSAKSWSAVQLRGAPRMPLPTARLSVF